VAGGTQLLRRVDAPGRPLPQPGADLRRHRGAGGGGRLGAGSMAGNQPVAPAGRNVSGAGGGLRGLLPNRDATQDRGPEAVKQGSALKSSATLLATAAATVPLGVLAVDAWVGREFAVS